MRPACALVILACAVALAAPAFADSSPPGPRGRPAAPAKTKAALHPSDSDRDGDGVPDAVDKCPDDPEDRDGFQDEDGCPDPDNDADGIRDVDDLCPNDAEDRDGFEDEDGCPDPDNDHDRILDKDDKCPNEPETYNGFEDEDGCPDKGRITVTTCTMTILDRVYFRTGDATIGRASEPILKAVAETLQGNPALKRVAVNAHTDADEAKQHAGIGRRRAEAVAAYLVRAGVKAERLEARDLGATEPLASNATADGRTKNRRIEFLILEREGDPAK